MSSKPNWEQKLDKDYLLSISFCQKLSQIEELNLTNLGLYDTDLLPDVFNCLTSLVELNLSGNRLSCIPDDIKLPKLQYLDLSKNCIKAVTWINQFKELIELDIEGNVALTIDDNYKVIFLLENLQFINGKRIDNREKFGSHYTKGLIFQMEKLWNSLEFGKKLKHVSREVLMEQFVKKAIEKVRHGPNSLKEYRHWRINRLAKEFLQYKLVCPEQSFLQTLTNNVRSIQVCKHKSDCSHDGPSSKAQKFVGAECDYSVSFALQCHSQHSGSKDFATQIWCCEFEPNINKKSTNMVATCGGESICLINCETGKVESKFQQPNEEFFTLAWTTMYFENKFSNILVAGGCLGFIHLIHPEQDICYGRIKTHSAPVQSLVFSPTGQTHLLSADRRSKIFLLDIDVPTTPEYKFSWKKLIVFEGIQETPLKLLVPDAGLHLLCATEHGLYCWETNGFTNNYSNTVKTLCEITFPFVNPEVRIVDALSIMPPSWIVSKCAQQGVIFLWNFSSVKTDISKAIKQNKSTVAVKIDCELKWSMTKQCYINLDCCKKHKHVVAGDEKGNLWIYNVASSIQRRDSSKCPVPLSVVNPNHVITFPACTINSGKVPELRNGSIFNDVCVSEDGKCIVAVADSNLVVIYRKK